MAITKTTEDRKTIAEHIVGRTVTGIEFSGGAWITFDDGTELEVGADADGVTDCRLYPPD